MKKWVLLITVIILYMPVVTLAAGASSKIEFPDDVTFGIGLELKLEMDKNGEFRVAGNLIVTNPFNKNIVIQHPENRSVLAFVVTDTQGNIVIPKGFAKVDPELRVVDVEAGADYEYQFEHLRFLTGSAQFGYELRNDQSYKVIAIFRPAGLDGPGFTSNEVSINIF